MAGHTEVNQTSSLGWIYVVVSDFRSPGPRQPVPSWLPGTAVAVYGSLLIVVGVLLNATVLGSSLAVAKGSTVPAPRRLLTANLAVVQLAAAVVVVPAGVVTEAVGAWTFGGPACRAWLVGQVLLIASAMWSVVGLDVDCLLRLAAPRRAYATLAERHPRTVAAVTIISSWVVAALAALPIGLAVGNRQKGTDTDPTPILEDVCAVNLSSSEVIAQSLTTFLLPGTIGLTGSVAILATKAFRMIDADGTGRGECVGRVAVAAVSGACVVLWCPFFVLYTVLPFCGDGLCVDPATWTLFAWVGHSTVAVAPAAWFIDPAVRSGITHVARQFRRRFSRCPLFESDVASAVSSAGNVGDESSCLISVAQYQIHSPPQHHRQQSPNDSPSAA